MKHIQTFESFLNEYGSLDESAKGKGIMDKVANALKRETKPLGHKDFLGFDNALVFVGAKEPLRISLIDKDQTLLFYKDSGDSTETIAKYPVKDFDGAIDAITKYLEKNS
jgi:hypothetical protein